MPRTLRHFMTTLPFVVLSTPAVAQPSHRDQPSRLPRTPKGVAGLASASMPDSWMHRPRPQRAS